MKRLLLSGILLLGFPAMAQETWERVKQTSAVTVYTKNVPGSAYKAFKAVGIVHATPHRLLQILQDVSSYPQWFAYSHTVRLLHSTLNAMYVYMETDFPWPFRNKDMIYSLSVAENGGSEVTLVLDGKPDYIPAIEGIHRMHDANGYIVLQPVEDDTIVTYVMNIEPGGDIPPWLANQYIHLMPLQTISNLIRIAER